MKGIDWQANCERVQRHLQYCVEEKRRLRALIEDLLDEIENTGDYEWWRNARADYEAIER